MLPLWCLDVENVFVYITFYYVVGCDGEYEENHDKYV